MLKSIGRFLCKIGLHKWESKGSLSNFTSNVIDYKYQCSRCGKKKVKVVAKDKYNSWDDGR